MHHLFAEIKEKYLISKKFNILKTIHLDSKFIECRFALKRIYDKCTVQTRTQNSAPSFA